MGEDLFTTEECLNILSCPPSYWKAFVPQLKLSLCLSKQQFFHVWKEIFKWDFFT